MTIMNRQYVHELVDRLPDPLLGDIAQLLHTVEQLTNPRNDKKPPYTPVKMGGLWSGASVSDEDIESVRREMWRNFGRLEANGE